METVIREYIADGLIYRYVLKTDAVTSVRTTVKQIWDKYYGDLVSETVINTGAPVKNHGLKLSKVNIIRLLCQ